jgi:hypothetical protein
MDPTDPESTLDFARTLLGNALADQSSAELPPEPSLADLDALAGFGGAVGDDVRFSVYVLDAWGRGEEHAAKLRHGARSSGRTAEVAVNGSLLLVATVPAQPSIDDRILLNELLSAFAGRE